VRSKILGQENPSVILFTITQDMPQLKDWVYQDTYDSGSICGKPITKQNGKLGFKRSND
jgi:hypothetical protein